MKVTDLMVGDWVEVVQNGEKHFAQVQMIDGYGDNATANECICDAIYYSINEIEPIPLTPEILEKNGFIKKKNFMQLGNFDNPPLIMWHLEEEKILHHLKHELEIHHAKIGIHVSINVEYVHELQHILKLCGIEKEILL